MIKVFLVGAVAGFLYAFATRFLPIAGMIAGYLPIPFSYEIETAIYMGIFTLIAVQIVKLLPPRG